MTGPTLTPHRNRSPMIHREQLAPFVIVGHTPGGALTIPTTSARTAAQAARHLTEHCPHTQATWQANLDAGPGPVTVLGRARPPTRQYPPHQDTHAFLLVPGEALPPIWVALCGHRIRHPEFEALDQGMGSPCPGCHQRWAGAHQQHTGLPLRSPGTHLHPHLRRPPLTSRSHQGDST